MLQFSKSKIFVILLTVVLGFMAASPNFLPEKILAAMPDWYPRATINLGLDLQGGSYMLLEVDVEAVMTERLDALEDDTRRILRDERIRFTNLVTENNRRVHFKVTNDADVDRALDLVDDLSAPVTSNLLLAVGRTLDVTREGNLITLAYTEQGIAQIKTRAVEQSVESVRRRIDELGTKEPTVQRQGEARILVQIPGANINPGDLIETAKLTFHLVEVNISPEDIANGRVPPRSMLLPMSDDETQMVPVRRRAMVSGENLTNANPSFDQRSGLPIVTISFDTRGATAFCRASQDNVGRQFAIVLDNKIISAPVIQEAICGGRAQISGNFTVESSTKLAALLRAGALPAPLKIMEQRSVGPGLGADSVAAGKTASWVGMLAVVLFVAIYYQRFGIAADFALAINLVLITGALSFLGATLTLPGFAGIVLTIGMAVDANVLIFERIREEVHGGKPPLQAVSAGYSSAMSTILDANITTLIAAVIMFQYGTGPVRGFAVTLAIGIVTSVFSAVTLTRFMVSVWLKRKRPKTLKV